MDSARGRGQPHFEVEAEEDPLTKYLLGQVEEIEALGSSTNPNRNRSRDLAKTADLGQLADRIAYVNGVA